MSEQVLKLAEAMDDACRFDVLLDLHALGHLVAHPIQKPIEFVVDHVAGCEGLAHALRIWALFEYILELALAHRSQFAKREFHDSHEPLPLFLQLPPLGFLQTHLCFSNDLGL